MMSFYDNLHRLMVFWKEYNQREDLGLNHLIVTMSWTNFH